MRFWIIFIRKCEPTPWLLDHPNGFEGMYQYAGIHSEKHRYSGVAALCRVPFRIGFGGCGRVWLGCGKDELRGAQFEPVVYETVFDLYACTGLWACSVLVLPTLFIARHKVKTATMVEA